MKKGNILSLISILIIIYSIIVNIFFPLQNLQNSQTTSSLFPELKTAFINKVKASSNEETAGLGLSYLIGEKDDLPEGIEQKMKSVGLAHIIVVSGTHLSIIITASRKIFEKISRFSALYFSLALLLFYINLVGLSPSLLRASFVAVYSLLAWFFGRTLKPERTVLLTLGFCLLANPYLLTNLGFEFSILSYFGITILFPVLKTFFYGPKNPSFPGKIILSSLSASIACLPLQLYFFGSFNFLSLLSNLLILPTIPLSMGLSFFTGLFGLLNLPFTNLFGALSNLVLTYHIGIINFLNNKTEFLLEFPKKNPLFLFIYLILTFSIIKISRIKYKKRLEKFKKLKSLKTLDLWE
ncbi:ComEC/Rec2 family competence protein [Candidatus Saccharibacteria bacterium]|nr:ComEC/Rec2 family competence protein [Candidatus Saccharibacteria bacterium]